MTSTINFSWSQLVQQADPEHTYESNNPVEYEFTSPGRGRSRGNDQTHRDGMRIFRGYYKTRGPYSVVAGDPVDGLLWNGEFLIWNGQQLIWRQVNP